MKNLSIECSEIESIEFIGEEETIDICVDKEHMFFANNIYTHNSGFGNDMNDISSIGKAIEIFQVADIVMSFAQKAELEDKMECIAVLLKNRHGKKNIALLCHYDPNRGVFIEKEVLNQRVLMSVKERKQVMETTSSIREKLQTGLLSKKHN